MGVRELGCLMLNVIVEKCLYIDNILSPVKDNSFFL
jgi:hypothetical protein